MKALSASPQKIIEQCIDEYTQPLCVILDDNFMVKSWSGDYSYYGYDDLDIGKDCRDSMLFLVGLNTHDAIHLRFIETPNARAAHVQLFIDAEEMTLVLLDATEQRVNHALVQQKGNKLALMHAQQTTLIETLKRLEKEVEAKRHLAEQANQLKGQFIATMSHEFRTPLTSILGYASRLKQTCGLAPTPIKYLKSVERGAQHLLSLVENLLDHAQMESDNLSINPIATNVNDIFGQLISIFTSLAEDKYLRFSLDVAPEMPGFLFLDEMRFRQLLVHLISNAIKYTDQGSVHVQANWEKDEITVSVKDTGNGIAEADQQRIFIAFEQLGVHLGTGLGLSITKHLVTAMGGQLVLTSKLEQGSCFQVSLPARQVTLSADESQSEVLRHVRRNKKPLLSVLLVEDDPDVLQLLQCVFDDTECNSLLACNGNDALNTALSDSPDLIILDLNLPDISGLEVMKTLRNNNFNNPVFVQSAWVSSELKAQARAAGCNEYLTKPLDISQLMQLVSDYFIKHADFGMSAERYQQLYQRFLGSLPEKHKTLEQLEINNIQYSWSCPARPELQYYAHRLAGSAEMYGFSSIGKTAKQLDQLLLDYDRLESHHDSAQLREKISSLIALLRHQIAQAIAQA